MHQRSSSVEQIEPHDTTKELSDHRRFAYAFCLRQTHHRQDSALGKPSDRILLEIHHRENVKNHQFSFASMAWTICTARSTPIGRLVSTGVFTCATYGIMAIMLACARTITSN